MVVPLVAVSGLDLDREGCHLVDVGDLDREGCHLVDVDDLDREGCLLVDVGDLDREGCLLVDVGDLDREGCLLVDVSGADLDVLALVDQLARPTPKNPDGGPRFARLRGDRRETGAPGRAERPSKWRG